MEFDIRKTIPISVVIVIIYFVSQENYLLAHSIVEVFSIVIAFGIFLVAWNSRAYSDHQMFVFLGIGYIFVGSLDFVHTLAYKGMGVFSFDDPNYPTQLWIAARFLEAITILVSLYFISRRFNPFKVFMIYFVSTSALIYLIFEGCFPDCFIEGSGLTTFKITCEYIIILIIAISLYIFYTKKEYFDNETYNYITIAFVSTILAELSFTLYTDVYGVANIVGHLFKTVSFYFIYLAIVEKELVKQYFLMFRSIKDKDMQNEMLQHDLSNYLIALYGYLEIYDETSDQKMLKKAKKVIENSIEMMNHMKEFSLQSAGYFKTYNLRSVIEEIAYNISESLDITIKGNARIEGDEAIYSLFSNLIHNAIIHGKTKKIEIEISKHKTGSIIRLADHGKGIPDEIKPELFRKGYSYGDTRGTGFGLYLVDLIVKRYNGSIKIEDNDPKGTVFIIELNQFHVMP